MFFMRNMPLKLFIAMGALISLSFLLTSCLGNLFDQPPKPVIRIINGSPYGPAPLTVTFDVSGSNDPDGQIVSFTFDFADGSNPVQGTDLTQPITHTYTTPGQYLVTLTVVDNVGRKEVAQAMVLVSESSG